MEKSINGLKSSILSQFKLTNTLVEESPECLDELESILSAYQNFKVVFP